MRNFESSLIFVCLFAINVDVEEQDHQGEKMGVRGVLKIGLQIIVSFEHSFFCLLVCFLNKWTAYREENALLQGLDKRFSQDASKHFWSSYYYTRHARQIYSSHVSNACEKEKCGSLWQYVAQGLRVRETKGNSG